MPSPQQLCDHEVTSSSGGVQGVTAAPADSISGGDADQWPTSTAHQDEEDTPHRIPSAAVGNQHHTIDSASGDATGGAEVDPDEMECEYPAAGYEYLDHPADVQLHGWGTSLTEAFEQTALAMFGYMTDLDTVAAVDTQEITAQGHDLESLLFHFLDEWLFMFSAEPFFVASHVEIVEFDRQLFRIRARGYGETFDLDKHPQGTEVKAITYSNLQVHDADDQHEVFVIIDI